MAFDPFAFNSDTPTAPAAQAFAIIPSNTVELPQPTKAIYVGTGGHVTLRALRSSADVVYRNVPAGSYLTVRAVYVRATGTTAADLVGEG